MDKVKKPSDSDLYVLYTGMKGIVLGSWEHSLHVWKSAKIRPFILEILQSTDIFRKFHLLVSVLAPSGMHFKQSYTDINHVAELAILTLATCSLSLSIRAITLQV
jgi:hypothetical protein